MNTSRLNAPLLEQPLKLSAIAPAMGEKYSPNLHAFLSARKNSSLKTYGRVFEDAEGLLWLGYFFDGDFIGARMSQVLCYGRTCQMYSYSGMTLKKLPEFWRQYEAHGRCALDPEHQMFFLNDKTRWAVHGDTRHCQWCGKVSQQLKTRIVSHTEEYWEMTA